MTDEELDELEDFDDEDEPRPTRASPPPGLRTSKVDLDRITKQLLNVLRRETRALLLASAPGKRLSKDDADMLVKYLRLSKDLKKSISKDEIDKMSDEELEKLAK